MEKVTEYLMPFVIVGLGFIVSWQESRRDTTLKELQSTHTYIQVDSLQTITENQRVELLNTKIELDKYVMSREKFREYNPLSAQEWENIYISIETDWKGDN